MSGVDNSAFMTPRSSKLSKNDIATKLEDGVLRPGGLRLTKRMVDCCSFACGAKVIDIGCGTGVTVEYLRGTYGLDAVGVDSSAVLLQHGKSRSPGLPLILSVGEALPFVHNSFSGAVAECSLSVMGDADSVLAEISRILVPGGKLAMADIYIRQPDGAIALRSMPCARCISGAMTRAELMQKLADHGFGLIAWEDQSNCLKEFMARLIMEHDSLDEFWQNALFGKDGGQAYQSTIKKAGLGYFWLVAEKKPTAKKHKSFRSCSEEGKTHADG